MKYSLAITIGHNSSAVLIQDGKILAGYEEERFSQNKSDSSFPYKSLETLMKDYHLKPDTDVYVSHWMLDGKLVENKYWDPNFIQKHFPKGDVKSLEIGLFSHHDAHAEAAEVFVGPDFGRYYHMYVMDGFGTAGECISLYLVTDGERKLLQRVYGFEYSLGMFFQYATAFCGMKMFNHEYKMLAYETRITNVPVDTNALDDYILEFSNKIFRKIFDVRDQSTSQMDPMITLDALVNVRQFVDSTLDDYLIHFGFHEADLLTRRILVSYFAQSHLENVIMGIQNLVNPVNLVVSGGVFYNVKINHMLAQTCHKFSAYPLCGDQGAGIGVYQYYNMDLVWPEHLFWGHRHLDYETLDLVDGIMVLSRDDAEREIRKQLRELGFVNIVRGAMEFGPRALCHTTTLAQPSLAIADLVNRMNDRTNEMPFALVCTEQQAHEMFEDIYKVHKSLEYMIITRRFRSRSHAIMVEGGAHYYPLTGEYTCRPQITRDVLMTNLLSDFGPLINTSWNYHGVPIVYNEDHIIYTHMKERAALPDVDFKTIIIKE